MIDCPFCKNNHLVETTIGLKTYYQCVATTDSGCGGFFLHPDYFDTPNEQKKRYSLHTNELTPENKPNGYRKYLEKFISNVLQYERKKEEDGNIHTLFDYGSGPSPALVMLLEELNMKFVFKNDVVIKHWDPFFCPDGDFFEYGADIVFCLEVIEHFEQPLDGFKGLEKACAKNGLIAIQTGLAPKSFDEFKKWWYKEDSTHVSFYTHKSIEECAKKVGLQLEGETGGIIFLRKK